MTVNELIELLETIKDRGKSVYINIDDHESRNSIKVFENDEFNTVSIL
jgi:hypothetical protein